MPELFEVIPHTSEDRTTLPDPNVPYYVLAAEGIFLHRKTQIGTVLVRDTKTPPTLAKLGFPNGVFDWTGDKIPAKIISQATDFFRRIYTNHATEAEVLITKHDETGEYRLFIPHQRVSAMGVKSVYEPTHIAKGWLVVGTLHSHCMMGAFHSGTDSGDASDMDGIHFTIGRVMEDPPQIVAMVTMNGKEFHYKDPSDIAELNFNSHTAPPQWDTYVYPADTDSVKPKSLKSITQAQWNEFRGIAKATIHTAITPYKLPKQYEPHKPYEPKNSYYPRAQHTYSPYQSQPIWGREGELLDFQGSWGEADDSPYKMTLPTNPPRDLSDILLLADNAGLLTDDDFMTVTDNQESSPHYWKFFFEDKAKNLETILGYLTEKTKNINTRSRQIKGTHR